MLSARFVARFIRKTKPVCLVLALSAGIIIGNIYPHPLCAEPVRETVVPAFHYALPNVPGKAITALIVDYPPGGVTPPHMHGKNFVVGYVLEGDIRSQLDNGQEIVYHCGQSWQEMPGAHHKVSRNDSTTRPAKLLAIFIGNANDKKLIKMENPPHKTAE